MTVQIVEIAGQKMAMLPIDDYQMLLDAAEERADVYAAMAAEQRWREGEEYLPAEMVDRIMAGESALRVWRKYRGLKQKDLAKEVGCTASYISMIETGNRDLSPPMSLWRKIAEVLNVTIDDLVPLND